MSAEDKDPLAWTGERYVPKVAGNIRLEHLHRYLIARELSHDKRVLDIACGEGYGSDILATVAGHVVGVDIVDDVIMHASSRYTRPNLEFKQGACEAIPLPDHSVDVVVSFETLEHIRFHDDMMREVRRVLCAGGLLVISNPERHEYSEVLGNQNPYHVSELYRDEFERLLWSYFRHVAVGGQRVRGGSIVGPLDESTNTSFASFPFSTTDVDRVQGVQAPVYLLALASDEPLPAMPVGLLEGGDFVWAPDLANLLSQVQGQCAEELSRRLGDAVQLDGASIEAIRAEFTRQVDRVSDVVRLLAAHEEKHNEAERYIKEFDALRAALSADLERARTHTQTVGSQILEANRKLSEELEALRGTPGAEIERARMHALAVGSQLLEANARLSEANARLAAASSGLAASRAIAKAHAAAEEWLERKVHRLEANLEAQRDREGRLTEDVSHLQAQLTGSQAQINHLQAQFVALQAQVDVYEHSRSWRLTAPLRAARRFGRVTRPVQVVIPQVEPLSREEPAKDPVPVLEPPKTAVVAESAPAAEQRRPYVSLPKPLYEETTADYVSLKRLTPVETRIKLIALYLPQFHPIPENDIWWGKGFTEWTSVTRAKPQFEGHYQPHLPGELGFYDLRLPEIQQRQIELATLYGIHGFCYYHYWFHGRKLLQRPLQQLLDRPELDFPFCICWANENWTRRWDGREDECLITQRHSSEDDLEFIRDIEPALRDPRYIHVGGRPLLLVYRPALFPDAGATAERWRTYCREVGLGELFLMSTHAFDHRDPRDFGFDAALEFVPNNVPTSQVTAEMSYVNPGFRGTVYDYQYLVETSRQREAPVGYRLFRSVMPMWDNEARRPCHGNVYVNSSPALYREWLKATCHWTERHVGIDKPFVFVNAWNEWAEGTHLEPDRQYGYAYLEATAEALAQFPIRAGRPSIVFVSHDAYFHGAQLNALNQVRTLAGTLHYNVEVILCGPGPLTEEFEAVARVHDFGSSELTRESKLAIARQLYDQGARIAICNTSVVGEAVELLKLTGFSVVSLVHELPDLIQERGLERSVERIARHADRVVFGAEVVRDRFIELSGLPVDRSVVQPQGLYAPNKFFGRRDSARCELRARLGLVESTRVVLGVGYADHRKGVDLFVDVGMRAAEQLPDTVFLWVGNQEVSAFTTAWTRVEQAGLDNRFLFPGPTQDPDLFFAGADVYLMTSREDPFPSVVLEALDAELPVIGFEGAGGFVELLQRGCGVVVPYGDTHAMTDALVQILGSPDRRQQLVKVGRELLTREFSFVNYVRTLVELVRPAGPKVSVVVPNYNYAQYLPGRLKSIINQTYPPHEVLFLDDCSTDGSVEIAAEMLHASRLSYRIITNNTNQGTYRQWLRGIRETTGDLIWIAEADDDCAPGLLERLVREFERPDVVLAYSQSRQIDEEGRELAPDYLAWTADISDTKWCEGYVRPGIDEIADTLVVKNTIPNVSAVLMRRIDLSSIEPKLVALRNAGDWLLYVHLLEHGNIAFVPEVLNSHRRHASSVTIGRGGLNLMREILMVQQHVVGRHRITADAKRQKEAELQRTYKYLGLSADGPPSYKDHPTLRAVEWAAMG